MRWAMRDQTPVLDQGDVAHLHHPHYHDDDHVDQEDYHFHCHDDYHEDDVNLEELFCSVHF